MGKWLMLMLVLPVLVSCGTVTTLSKTDEEVSHKLRIEKTYCNELPRVYSGATYNMCILNSNRGNFAFGPLALIYILDGVLSSVTDTLVLPYTAYQQYQHGSIELQ